MDLLSWSKRNFEEPEPKRITSPAGLRLSTILESDNASSTVQGSTTTKSSRRASIGKYLYNPQERRESQEVYSNGNYSYSIFSEKPMPAPSSPRLPPRVQRNGFFSRRGGWKRLALIVLFCVLIVIAIAIGLAVGLHHQNSTNDNGQVDSSANTSQNPSGTTSGLGNGGSGAGGNSGSGNATTNPNFPIGSYSIQTFLDTVQTNCTTDPNTFTCFPYTIYNDSPTKALVTFNWIITGDSKTPKTYTISSTSNPFGISFSNAPLTLQNEGTADEKYYFRTAMSKKVIPSTNITLDNAATTCFFNTTNFQGYLYTKRAKDYDPAALGVSDSEAGAAFQAWPYAVRAEQVSAAGDGTPDCYRTVNGVLGEKIAVPAAASGDLCSCLYKNWRTPV